MFTKDYNFTNASGGGLEIDENLFDDNIDLPDEDDDTGDSSDNSDDDAKDEQGSSKNDFKSETLENSVSNMALEERES